MRIRVLRWLAPALLLLANPAAGYGSTISITGGTAGTIPAGGPTPNDFIGPLFPGPSIGGFYGAEVDITAPPGSQLRLDFFGAEAGFSNDFSLGVTQLFSHIGNTLQIAPNLNSPFGTFGTTILGLGLLAFHFDVNSHLGNVFNGPGNPNNSGHNLQVPNFFLSCNPFSSGVPGPADRNCDTVYAFLDDGGGSPFDPDYDDLLVRLTVQAVPEPATLALLGFGLLGGSLLVKKLKHV